jgi:hypothetical protein
MLWDERASSGFRKADIQSVLWAAILCAGSMTAMAEEPELPFRQVSK